MLGPNSPESEERSSPDAPRWEDMQTRDTRYLLAQACTLCSQRQPIPFELDLQAISNHTGDLALEITAGLARDFNPKQLGFGNYIQRDNIFPAIDGMDIANPDAVNAAFKITCVALSTRFEVLGQGGEGMRVLHAINWFRAAMLVVSAALWDLLSSEDIVHQGSTLVALCLDNFEVDPSINFPNMKLQLLSKLTEQWHGEIGWAAQVVDGVDVNTIWVKNKTDTLEHLKVEARAHVAQAAVCWEARLLADLQDRSVNEALLLMIMCLEDEDGNEQCRTHAHTARELMTIGADQQARWRAQEMARQRTAVEDEVYAELALWKVSKLEQEICVHISAALAATLEEEWATLRKLETEKAITKAKETAEVFTCANYDNYFIAAQHRLFPNVEELAQKGDEASALVEEQERIYPGMWEQPNAEAKAEVREYWVTCIARLQAEMEQSIQEEEIMVIQEAVVKRGYTLQDAAQVLAVKRPQKKSKSHTICEALKESSGPVMGEKCTVEGRSHVSSLLVTPVHVPADPDHPMVLEDTSDSSDDTPSAFPVRK